MKTQSIILFAAMLGLIACASSSITYDYADQGATWATDELGDCAGSKQSPIDLTTWTSTNCNTDIVFNLEFDTQAMTDVDIKYPGDSADPNNIEFVGAFSKFRMDTIEQKEHSFSAIQFHLHSPSEHTVDGDRKDVELHIVHTLNNDDDSTGYSLAVFGILFELDTSLDSDANAAAETIFGKLDIANIDANTGSVDSLTASSVFSSVDLTEGLWAYQGSLTTPPCTEAVNWFVSNDIQKISTAQLTAIQDVLQSTTNDKINSALGNYRAVQPLGDRTLYQLCEDQNTASFTFVEPASESTEEDDDDDDDDDGESQSRLIFASALILLLALLF